MLKKTTQGYKRRENNITAWKTQGRISNSTTPRAISTSRTFCLCFQNEISNLVFGLNIEN